MSTRRVMARVGSFALGVVLVATALTGCAAPTHQDLADRWEKDPAVAGVIVTPATDEDEPAGYAIVLRDDVDPGEAAEVNGRLWRALEERAGSAEVRRERVRWAEVSVGGWSWMLTDDKGGTLSSADVVAGLARVDGAGGGRAFADDTSIGIQLVADAGTDPAALVPAAAHAFDTMAAEHPRRSSRSVLTVSDLPHRRSITTTANDADREALLGSIPVAAAAGEVVGYELGTDRDARFQLRTADQAAAADAPVQSYLHEHGLFRAVVTGGVQTGTGGDAAAAAAVAPLVDSLDGVSAATVERRKDYGQVLSVQFRDAEAAVRAQDALAAAPPLQALDALEIVVGHPDMPGAHSDNTAHRLVTALSPKPFTGYFEGALALAEQDGVAAVVAAPFALDVELRPLVAADSVAATIKQAARPTQQVQITSRPMFSENASDGGPLIRAFRVEDELVPSPRTQGSGERRDGVTGYGDVGAFVKAWNQAEGSS